MKLLKRATILVAASMTFTGSVSCIYANEASQNIMEVKPIIQISRAAESRKVTTGPAITSIWTEVRSEKTYVMIKITSSNSLNYVDVDGKAAKKYSSSGNTYTYSYQITSSGRYDIYVQDREGYSAEKSYDATVKSTKKPTLELSQKFKNGKCYLVIKASATGKIKSVTVDGREISFDADGETREYEVKKSGKYTVVVKDDSGNETTEKLSVDVDADNPSVKLTSIYKDKKFYLVIKASPGSGNKISKVTVNGKGVSFRSSGDEVEYEISNSGRYNVVVIDDLGLETSDSIYIDVNVDKKAAPTLTLSTITSGPSSFLVITANDNDKIAKLTINGISVGIGSAGGTLRYPIAATGNYTVVVTDNDGNETQKSIYATVGNSINMPNTAHQIVKFKLNDKNWTKDGVKQSAMDTPPVVKNQRIYLPLRQTAYALGISQNQIQWDSKSQTAIIIDGSDVIKVKLNSKMMYVNNEAITMDGAALSQNGRILLPISQVAKAFKSKGVTVNWDNMAKEATITRTK